MVAKLFWAVVWSAVMISHGSGQVAGDAPVPPEIEEKFGREKFEEKLHKLGNFDKLENPPLLMGDTGDRVRELQATLNYVLGGETIDLRHSIYVDHAEPNGRKEEPKNQRRLAYSRHRDKAFQIRGDWIPVDSKGNALPPDDFKVDHLKLPKEPLKVDGIFGQQTKTAVALFQHDEFITVSGEVDALTLDRLEPLIPTNPILAFIMRRVGNWFPPGEHYAYVVKTVTSILVTLIILLAALVVYQIARSLANSTHFISKWLFTPESSPWFTALFEKKVFRRLAQFAPAFFIYLAAQWIFPSPDETNDVFPYMYTFQKWNVIVSHLGLAYVSLIVMLVGLATANAIDSVSNPNHETDNPIGSIIRAAKRAIGCIGTLLIIASLAGKSPFIIAGGLGAFMAVFILVFKDYLLGLVSSIQIIANKVVEIGDWISMPSYDADGTVLKISLTLIKVQNADKTISTIPTSAILRESFQNWAGVERAGVRRIKRSILIDMRQIRVCTPEMIGGFGRIELIQDYLEAKSIELLDYNQKHPIEASAVNSRRLTNIGTFRAYLDRYLRAHPGLDPEMPVIVRHLQPGSIGLPIEIYAFCNSTDWAHYEAVQADIFDHLLAVLPEFGLRAFQEITEAEAALPDGDLSASATKAGLAELESLIAEKNRELADNSRTRPSSRVQSIRKRIAELDLSKQFSVGSKGRRITLEHLGEN